MHFYRRYRWMAFAKRSPQSARKKPSNLNHNFWWLLTSFSSPNLVKSHAIINMENHPSPVEFGVLHPIRFHFYFRFHPMISSSVTSTRSRCCISLVSKLLGENVRIINCRNNANIMQHSLLPLKGGLRLAACRWGQGPCCSSCRTSPAWPECVCRRWTCAAWRRVGGFCAWAACAGAAQRCRSSSERRSWQTDPSSLCRGRCEINDWLIIYFEHMVQKNCWGYHRPHFLGVRSSHFNSKFRQPSRGVRSSQFNSKFRQSFEIRSGNLSPERLPRINRTVD